MSRSRVKRVRGLTAALPEGCLLSSTQMREGVKSLKAPGKNAALTSAALAIALGLPLPALAQETAAAQEQVPTLPPVVVIQQKTVTPASRPSVRSEGRSQDRQARQETDAQPASSGSTVPGSGGTAQTGMFSLGGINLMGGTYITSDQTWYFAKPTLDQAMALAPGVVASNSGGTRNEQMVFVRGFNRLQVPVSIDGVRVYLPYDNRIDFSDFVTADISEIQIAKGYASVLDGPGAIGGAINLVTKRPTKELEIEAGSSMTLARDGSYQGFSNFASVGTRQNLWYMLMTGTINDRKGWMLSEDFTPTANQGAGWRDNSQKEDWRVSAKVGFTPNATDEYAVSVIHQENSKGAPFHTTDPISSQRYWVWPGRDLTNIYENSTTRLGKASYINTKLYYTLYNDSLFAYDDSTLTTQTKPSTFQSFYHDSAYGGSVEAGTDITNWDTLKGAFHYRRDIHGEYNEMYSNAKAGASCGVSGAKDNAYAMPAPCQEPLQTSIEDTYSLAVENTYHLTKRIDLVTGASYDWRILYEAQDWTLKDGLFEYQKQNNQAFNWQGAAVYRYADDAKVYASVSDRTRFPTIFERFSSRFGGATSNPGLSPEQATNYEIGWAGKLGKANLSTAIFYSDVNNLIESVNYIDPVLGAVSQSRNVGHGYMEGWEGSADIAVTSNFMVGGNLTLMRIDIADDKNKQVVLTGVPDAKGIAYVKWRPIGALTITPNVEIASDRWTQNTSGTLAYKVGAYTLANISAEYEFRPGTTLNLTAHNLFDTNYTLTDGFPEPGRTVTVGMKMKF